MRKSLYFILSGLIITTLASAQALEPSGSYIFAEKDSTELFLDFYDAAPGSETSVEGKQKPAVIFVFGGGFMSGCRDDKTYKNWFSRLTRDGFKVFSIDYRLGLKGVKKMGIAQRELLENAIQMAVDDLYSATAFICENAAEFGIDPDRIIISGSSAGAITALQAEWERANGKKAAEVLPEGFKYAGVMAFAGGIYSTEGRIRYRQEPAPTLFFHGTSDKIVNYKQIRFSKNRFAGSDIIAKTFSKEGYRHRIYRFKGHGHEIAIWMDLTYDEQMSFIRTEVMDGKYKNVDAQITDREPRPAWGMNSLKDIYNTE